MSAVQETSSALSLASLSESLPECSKPKGFFDLPGEIRNQIYRYLLSPEMAILGIYEDPRRTKVLFERTSFISYITGRANEDALASPESQDVDFPRKSVAYRYTSSLLSVNRQIYQEASPAFYQENQFVCFLTSYPGLYRVLRECGFMRSAPSIGNNQWIATFKLRWNTNDRNKFVFIIPARELYILTRIFVKASSSRVLFFANCDFRIVLSDCLPSVSDKLAEMFLQPIRELYNVMEMNFDSRLQPLFPPWYRISLPGMFNWHRFFAHIGDDKRKSHELYFAGENTCAMKWAMSAIEDLNGARLTHYLAWGRDDTLLTTWCTTRQEMTIWVYKLELEQEYVGPSSTSTNEHNLRCATPPELDKESREVLSLAWETTQKLGIGKEKQALWCYDEMEKIAWTGGTALARCIHNEFLFAVDLWRECGPTFTDEFEETAKEIIVRDKERAGWMDLNA